MRSSRSSAGLGWLIVLLLTPVALLAQSVPQPTHLQVSAGGAFLTSSAYFTGPGGSRLSSGDGLAGVLQLSVPVRTSFAIVATAVHARPDWQLTGIPIVGVVDVPGASLWFFDAAVRASLPLAQSASPVQLFGQVGVGLARYSLNTTIVGLAVDEHATNAALGVGGGLALPVGRRVDIEAMAKDYIASFKSVRDLAPLGVEGKRSHTVLLSLSVRVGL